MQQIPCQLKRNYEKTSHRGTGTQGKRKRNLAQRHKGTEENGKFMDYP
jgi:hypothetical protein